jgi:predicted type IV restriction endonuclease
MLSPTKKLKLISALKHYKKEYLDKGYGDLDESATRLMINHFLTEVLGYKMIEEIKTEYMIRGTYADYVIQLNGNRHFLIEVKGFSLELSEKHLRQAINYGANEGIEWAILTNGRKIDLYKIIFDKPIDSKRVFSIDLTDTTALKVNAEQLQFLHKDSVIRKELEMLWKKHSALDPKSLACYLLGKPVINYLKKELRAKYKSSFNDNEISEGIKKVIATPICIDNIKPAKDRKKKEKLPQREADEIITPSESLPESILDIPDNVI